MHKQDINVVWLKRDLRLQDHKPLSEAENAGLPYIIIYCFEALLITHPDTSDRHLSFIYQSILEMKGQLQIYGRTLHVFEGEAIEIFKYLNSEFNIQKIFSHQETGIRLSWERDKQIHNFCKSNRIKCLEYPADNVQRGLKNRDTWDKHWYSNIYKPAIENSFSKTSLQWKPNAFASSKELINRIEQYSSMYQEPGEIKAWNCLESFMADRGKAYMKSISKPLASRCSCSRISVYLAWGNLSIRQVWHYVRAHENYEHNKRNYNAFLTRIKWRSHFIQKFEQACEYETECINPAFEKLEHNGKLAHLEAWKTGHTGFPMVDACMRCLNATGWINFRMRAMLVSFLCHQLDLDWRQGVYHMARMFLDYVPGIHYPQFQMQAGTTGVNTIRMYNPVKQALDHDPEAKFIKQWCPELASLPVEFALQPWLMTKLEQGLYGVELGTHYPEAIIDLDESSKRARKKIWSFKNSEEARQGAQKILKRLTRRTRIN